MGLKVTVAAAINVSIDENHSRDAALGAGEDHASRFIHVLRSLAGGIGGHGRCKVSIIDACGGGRDTG